LTLIDIRRLWPEVLAKVGQRRRMAWILLSQHAQAIGLEERRLTLGFNNPGARESFLAGKNDEILRQCLIDLIGDDLQVEAVIDQSAHPGAGAPPPVARPATSTNPGPPPTPSPPGQAAAPPQGHSADDAQQPPPHRPPPGSDGASPDDRDADQLDTEQLLAHRLGAQLIEETPRE
jgi:DNA polymerase III subunit gamma/tau